jgi:soluble lytic murein transglycosylase
MTIRNCLARIIPVLWCSALACALAISRPAPAKRRPAAKRSAAAAKRSAGTRRSAAAKRSPAAAPASGKLASLVRAWRDAPTPARRTAVAAYASAHSREASGALAYLALGVGGYEQKDFGAASAALKGLAGKLPDIADYVAWHLASARVESNDLTGISKQLSPVHGTVLISPLAARAWVLEARALKVTSPADAVRLLRARYAELPQPEGDITLADCYEAARDLPNAADFYQRVYYRYTSGDAATRAAAALLTLKDTMGTAYPAPLPEQVLARAGRLMEAREYAHARAEYQAVLGTLPELQRGQARVRIGAADFLDGNVNAGCTYLRGLGALEPEADAERLYYLVECARRRDDDGEMLAVLKHLAGEHSKSPWRLKALVSAANRFLLVNRPDDYVPLYKAAYEDFPDAPQAGLCHWKVTFQAYLRGRGDATDLLREHLRLYPRHPTAAAALYFLGRTAERAGDPGAARAFYSRFSAGFQNTYYAVVARSRLAAPELSGAASAARAVEFLDAIDWPQARPVPEKSTSITDLRIRRSRLLRTAGLAELADSELRFGARTDAQPALLAMEMAGSADAPHQALRAMKSMAPDYLGLPLAQAPRRFWELLFPLPYKTDLFASAGAAGLDPYLVAGLIRQESEFNPEARSRANALGLTQVRPGTGRSFARTAGLPRYNSRSLFQPAANLRIGTSILRSMLDRNGGSLERTLAAYNAGPNRAAEWLSWNTYREPPEFVESIPFTETRDYVQAVLRNADMYKRLYR